MSYRKRIVSLSVVAALVFAALQTVSVAQGDGEEKKTKHTIKEAMTVGHKDGLLKKILAGDANQEEKTQLLDLYISLVENEPPKGDIDSWHRLAGGAALAAAKVVVGRDGADAELKAATNCAACHKVHKPSCGI